jgi:hypothetical protein
MLGPYAEDSHGLIFVRGAMKERLASEHFGYDVLS